MVPEEISAWKPEIAPQAMVMKQNGKILPAKIGPVPSAKRVKAGNCRLGPHEQDADGQHHHDAELDEGAQVIARGQQQPDRQRARQEAIDDDAERRASSPRA